MSLIIGTMLVSEIAIENKLHGTESEWGPLQVGQKLILEEVTSDGKFKFKNVKGYFPISLGFRLASIFEVAESV